MQSAGEIGAQAIPQHLVSLHRDKCLSRSWLARYLVHFVNKFIGKMVWAVNETREETPPYHGSAFANQPVTQLIQEWETHVEVGQRLSRHFVLNAVTIDQNKFLNARREAQGHS